MATVASLVPRVTMLAPGLAEPVAEQHILDAAIEFCRETLILYGDLAPISVTANDATYSLGAATGSRVVKVLRAFFDGEELAPRALDSLPADWASDTGTPVGYYLTGEASLVLYPAPQANGTLNVLAATAPTRTATDLDDSLADLWLEAIVAGAVARTYMTPNQPYSNPVVAQAYAVQFDKAVHDARIKQTLAFTRAPLRVRPHPF